jgi:hypothetical protein
MSTTAIIGQYQTSYKSKFNPRHPIRYKLYHNPNFLNYNQENHNLIVVPPAPLATVIIPYLSQITTSALDFVYYITQNKESGPWYFSPDVTLHMRSTSVGDIIEDEKGQKWVVEAAGFRQLEKSADTGTVSQLLIKALEQWQVAHESQYRGKLEGFNAEMLCGAYLRQAVELLVLANGSIK